MEKTYIMKLRIITVPVLAGIMALTAAGQNVNRLEKGQTPPDGVVIYSLPMTSIHLSVEAVCETYTPGPYSKWAKKYLGIDVPQEASTSYTLSNIRMTPYLEADRSCSYIVNLDGFLGEASPASFFEFSSQGLLLLSDESKGKGDSWRFPSIAPGTEVLSSEATANLTSTETTLYRTVRNESGGYDRVAVRQSQVVEKSPEKKAQEAAAMILSLRENRINIITGNTDATFSSRGDRAPRRGVHEPLHGLHRHIPPADELRRSAGKRQVRGTDSGVPPLRHPGPAPPRRCLRTSDSNGDNSGGQ